ncbi:MAG: hypothetical protein KA371_03240 [Acidobacteria bacterium]|nr:hypothetical protein [Acidobacteriota bacterium]
MPDSHASSPVIPPPTRRPLERFWPYVELTEAPAPDELAALDPDLHAALFGPRDLPFSMTLVFPDFAGQGFVDAIAKAEAAREYRAVGSGAARRHRARFFSADAAELRELYALVGHLPESDVLIDDRPVPFARELWLPLLWFHLLS